MCTVQRYVQTTDCRAGGRGSKSTTVCFTKTMEGDGRSRENCTTLDNPFTKFKRESAVREALQWYTDNTSAEDTHCGTFQSVSHILEPTNYRRTYIPYEYDFQLSCYMMEVRLYLDSPVIACYPTSNCLNIELKIKQFSLKKIRITALNKDTKYFSLSFSNCSYQNTLLPQIYCPSHFHTLTLTAHTSHTNTYSQLAPFQP